MTFAVNTATTKELIAKYNQLTGKSIKKFSSRAAGERQVLAAMANSIATATKLPSPRKIKGHASAEAVGRPIKDFTVTLNAQGSSRPNAVSARRQLLEWLKTLPSKTASIGAIEAHFERNMRGVVGKLRAKNWLTVKEVE